MACRAALVCCAGMAGIMSRMTGRSASIDVRSITFGRLAAGAFLLVFQLAAPANPSLFVDDELLADDLFFTNKEASVADRADTRIVKTDATAKAGPAKLAATRMSRCVTKRLAAAADSQQPGVRPIGAAF